MFIATPTRNGSSPVGAAWFCSIEAIGVADPAAALLEADTELNATTLPFTQCASPDAQRDH
jgi:hypothetical protein